MKETVPIRVLLKQLRRPCHGSVPVGGTADQKPSRVRVEGSGGGMARLVGDLHDEPRKARPVPVSLQVKEVPGAGFPAGTLAEWGAEGLLVGKGDTERPPLLTAFKAADSERTFKMAIAQQIPGVVTADHDRVLHGVCRIIEPVFRGSDGGIDLPSGQRADR